MNESDIQSFSLETLLDKCGHTPQEFYYKGCLITSHINPLEQPNIHLFQYPTRLNAFGIFLCSKGSISFTAGLQRHTLEEKNLFVLLPGTIVQVDTIPQESFFYAIICEEKFIERVNIDLKLLTRLFLRVEKQPCLPLEIKEWKSITCSFDEIQSEGLPRPGDIYSVEILHSMIRTLAYKVCRIIERHIENRSAVSTSSRNRNDEYFNQFMRELGKHYMRHRTVGFYAERLNLSPKYLTTIIRKTSGRTAIEWIDDYVVLEAKNLLKYSALNIQEIADNLNFANQSFFGKYFKSHTGMTPSAYRTQK